MLETLHGLRKEKGDPHEGIKVDFVNPVTGEPVFKTLDYSAQLLRPGEETELKRETASTFYVVIEGRGATEVGGKRFDWSARTTSSWCRTSCGGATSIPARPTR